MNPDYFLMPLWKRILIRCQAVALAIVSGFCGFWVGLGKGIVRLVRSAGRTTKEICLDWWHGDLTTKGSYFVLGLGHMAHGQFGRGIIYLLLELLFIGYMILFGGNYLVMCFKNFFTGGNIGINETHISDVWDDNLGEYTKIAGDNSFLILLYGILTLFVVLFFVIVWLKSVREGAQLAKDRKAGIPVDGFARDLHRLTDDRFHITLLSLPMVGLFLFTIVPLVTMIFIAFTNYDANHEVPEHLFQWVGFQNFTELFSSGSNLGKTFWRVLSWTLIWAVLATFTNYFLGMLLAILINKKGIRCKKFFRTMFVSTIAVPQFVSLLIMSKMLDVDGGIITQLIENIFGYKMQFGLDINTTRVAIVIVNMWVGVPYSMLMCSGILMNIPTDLYESARMDGASPFHTFRKITLPYMLFVTGPYLITQFIGNINNFNVIYLLSGGGPGDLLKYTDGAKGTDLLITWLYKLSLGADRNYKLASVIGIIVFVISATFSLMVYNKSSAVKEEDNFQ